MELSKKDINNIRGALRQSYHMSEHYRSFLELHRLEIPRFKKNGERYKRDRVKYACEECKELFSSTQIDVDHKIPLGSFKSLDEIEAFIKRLYCDYENLQILCEYCHRHKTLLDNQFTRLVF